MPTTPDSSPATAHIDDLLPAYHAGALSPAEAAQVEAHLRGCAACRERSEQIAIDQIIRAAPAPIVGPELRQRVYARIAAASEADAAAPRTTLRAARRVETNPLARVHGPRVAQRGWLSAAAAVLLVTLLLSAFLALPHLRQRQGHTSKPTAAKPTTACPASATTATLPANAVLNDMALTSPTEGWAVGALQDNQGNATQGLIMRYSACHWTPANVSLPGIELRSISMDSPTDGWAAGDVYGGYGKYPTVLLHDVNGVWSSVGASQRPDNTGSIAALSMVSPDEGWIVTTGPGTTSNATGTLAGYTYRLWHYSRGSWTHIAAPTQIIDAIAPVGPDDLWIAGSDFVGSSKQTTHSFAHYRNGAWSVTPEPAGLWAYQLYAVSPTDIWASGGRIDGTSLIAHYDGAAWHDASNTLPAAIAGGKGVGLAFGAGEGWAYTLRAPSNATPPITLPHAIVGSVLRETDGKWQTLPWDYSDINIITTWAPTADGEVWATGEYWVTSPPTPLPGGGSTSSAVTHTVLLHYVDGAWSRYG